jgi:cobalt-zinc-cadmium efflux system outer membrane protein
MMISGLLPLHILAVTWLACSAPIPSDRAVDSEEAVITQEQAISLAFKMNPDLKALAHYLDGIRTAISQAKEFPRTSIDFDFDQQVTFLRSDESYFGISQEIEFPTRIGLRTRLAAREIEAAETEHELDRWQLALSVKALYQRLGFLQHAVAVARESLSIAERLHEMAEAKYKLGSVGKLDVLRAGVEKATAANDLADLVSEEKAARMQLNYLLGRKPGAAFNTTALALGVIPSEGIDILTALAHESRKELQAIRSRRSAAEVRRSLARSEFYPDFGIGFSRHRIAGELNSWDLTASISIPIFGRGAISGRVAEAGAMARGLDAEEIAAVARVELEVQSAFSAAAALADKVKRYRLDILEQAEEAFRIAQASYHEGEIENLELLESQRTLQEAKQGYAETVFAYNTSLIELERAVGCGIHWETESIEPTGVSTAGDQQ